MPLYVYACQQCGKTIERMQSFSADPLTVCETCGGELRRVLHPAGVIFRGSGFYTTDYGRSSNKSERHESGSDSSSGQSSSSSGSSTEKKSAAAATPSTSGSSSTSSS